MSRKVLTEFADGVLAITLADEANHNAPIISVSCLPKMRRGDAAAAFLRGNRFPAAEAVRLGFR